jgi:hypothetical protein
LVHKLPMAADHAGHWKNILASVLPDIHTLPNEEIRKKYFICHRHFTNADYKNIESRNLNKTAVPSVNLTDLTESHACPRLRCITKPTMNNPQPAQGESKVINIDLSKFVTPPKMLIKRKIDPLLVPMPMPSKKVKILYPGKSLEPVKQKVVVAPAPQKNNYEVARVSQITRNSDFPPGNGHYQIIASSSQNEETVEQIEIDSAIEQIEPIELEEFLPNPQEEEKTEVSSSPKKLVALFEVNKSEPVILNTLIISDIFR